MSLLDDLKKAAEAIDVQFQPAFNDIIPVLGALVHYTEHGDSLLKAAETGVDDVTKLLAPQEKTEESAPSTPETPPAAVGAPAAAGDVPPPVDAPVAPAAADALAPVDVDPVSPAEHTADEQLSDQELEAKLRDLEAIQASRRATSQQTILEPPSPAEPVTPPAAGSSEAV